MKIDKCNFFELKVKSNDLLTLSLYIAFCFAYYPLPGYRTLFWLFCAFSPPVLLLLLSGHKNMFSLRVRKVTQKNQGKKQWLCASLILRLNFNIIFLS